MGRLLSNEQLTEAVLDATRFGADDKTGWQVVAMRQDIATLKAVGEWLEKAATSDNAPSLLAKGIFELQQGRMPKEIKKEVTQND